MPSKAFYMDCSADIAGMMDQFGAELVRDLDVHHGDPAAEDLAGLLKGYPLLLNGHTVMSAELLDHLTPELERVVFLGTGAANYVDLAAAERLGVEVLTIANYGDRSVAEHAFALLLSAARDIAAMDRAMRDGRWDRRSGIELLGKRVGVVGYGGIGREFARIAQGFGMAVMVWNRSPIELAEGMTRAAELADLFAGCEAVSLHLSFTPETRNFIGRELLMAMRPGAILVNTARAEVVDPAALCEALSNGPLGHAAIDVFEPEPPNPDDPLFGLDNVTLAAHTAWKTPDAARRLMELGLKKLWDGK